MDFLREDFPIDPAEEDGGEQGTQRHHDAFCHKVETVYPAEFAEHSREVLSQAVVGNQSTQNCGEDSEEPAVEFPLVALALVHGVVDKGAGDGFQNCNGGGQRRDDNQSVEDKSDERTDAAHAVEYGLQGHVQKSYAALRRLTAGKYGRHDCQTCQNGDDGVGQRDDEAASFNIGILGQMRTVGNGDAHSDRKGQEHLTAGCGKYGNPAGSVEHFEVRFEQECNSGGSTRQGNASCDYQDEHYEQRRHGDFAEPLDAFFDSKAYDDDGNQKEYQCIDDGLGGVRCQVGEVGGTVYAANAPACTEHISQIGQHVLDAVAAQVGVESQNQER